MNKLNVFLRRRLFLLLALWPFCICSAQAHTPKAVFADRYAAIVLDTQAGKTLFQENATLKRYPASLTKMMTLYLLFEAMQQQKVTSRSLMPVSEKAASQPPTKIGIKAGEHISVENAIKAIIIRSANDVAVAVAEYLGGTEGNFAKKMNRKARYLGMYHTHFANASGLPDEKNYSTAYDLAQLALALRKNFPQQYKFFNIVSFRFHNKIIQGHNALVKKMKGVDGIKTGYTDMSGANLASSFHQGKKRIIAVLMGGRSARLRDSYMAELLKRYVAKASSSSHTPLLLAKHTAQKKQKKRSASSLNQHDLLLGRTILTALASEDNQVNAGAKAASAAIIAPTKKHKSPHKETVKKQKKWEIQIGTAENEKSAQKLLQRASKAVGPSLAHAKPCATLVTNKKRHKYYRVRFTGFTSQKQIITACAALRAKHFNCFALVNN